MTQRASCAAANVVGAADQGECGCLACAVERAHEFLGLPPVDESPRLPPAIPPPDGFPRWPLDVWGGAWECFPELQAAAAALGSAGQAFWNDGWRATANIGPDLFDPWSAANELANSSWQINGLLRFRGAMSGTTRRGSPGADRLCVAISTDGRTWTKTGLILMDGASVPSVGVEVDPDGVETLYVYFNCATYSLDANGDLQLQNGEPWAALYTSVAYTTDLVNWSYRHMAGPSAPARMSFGLVQTTPVGDDPAAPWWSTDHPADPALVARPSGGWLLLVSLSRFTESTVSDANKPLSTFVLQANRLSDFSWWVVNTARPLFPTEDQHTADPTLAAMDPSGYRDVDQLVYHASRDNRQNWTATYEVDESNPAGDVFTYLDSRSDADAWSGNYGGIALANVPVKLSNPAEYTSTGPFGTGVDVEYYLAFGQPTGGSLRYLLAAPRRADTSPAALALADPAIVVPDRTFEGEYVMDAAVARFRGCYVMVYTTQLVP